MVSDVTQPNDSISFPPWQDARIRGQSGGMLLTVRLAPSLGAHRLSVSVSSTLVNLSQPRSTSPAAPTADVIIRLVRRNVRAPRKVPLGAGQTEAGRTPLPRGLPRTTLEPCRLSPRSCQGRCVPLG